MADRGWLADEVSIRINDEDVAYRTEDYSVNVSVFQQPSAFSLKLGAATIQEQWARHDNEMPFELALRHIPYPGENQSKEVVLQTGRLDTVDVVEGEGGTLLEYQGRDNMRELFKSYFKADTSYSEKSYYDLVLSQLEAVGFTVNDLKSGDTARELMAIQGTQVKPPKSNTPSVDGKTQTVEEVESGTARVVYNVITGNAGEQRYAWLRAQLMRAGLFLWCGPQGWFLLSAPNGDQEPAFDIRRNLHGEGNARLVRLHRDTTNRHWRVRVLGRAGGGKDGQKQVTGFHDDGAMLRRVNDYGAKRTVRFDIDEQIRTTKEAEYKARRLAAEERREAWNIEYQFSGHTVPALHAPGQRTVPLPNFCCMVNDERIGLENALMWVGDVTFARSMGGGTTTNVKLYRPEDLIFAIEDD
jgi:hypothetical protein